jgi:RNA polymerase primary sigma factor
MREDINNIDNTSLKQYFKEVRKHKQVSGDEQIELAIRAKNGDKLALNTLIQCNLRFVVSIAKEYTYTGTPLPDLIQEGSLGIIKAADKFDVEKGYKFISYAVWWIRQSILQSVYESGSTVRLPVNRINAVNKVSKATESLSKVLGRNPTAKEVSDFYIDSNTGEVGLTEKEVMNAYVDGVNEVSLNSTVSDESVAELHESIAGDGLDILENDLNKDSLNSEVDNILGELTEREGSILKMYFGIGDYEEMTLAEIGEKIGLTNERVRQIKEFSLKKLRTYNNSSRLREFIGSEIK